VPHRKRQKLEQISAETGIEYSFLVDLIRKHWITPLTDLDRWSTTPIDVPVNWDLDEEDVARARLILELRNDFGVNDEAMPIILHLLDELYAVRARLIQLVGALDKKAS